MRTKHVLLALIGLLAIVFPAAFTIAQDYLLAAFTFGTAAVWFILEINEQRGIPSLFFVVFLGCAVFGSLRGLPFSVMLAGLCIGLAAWDLSRFRARIANRAHPGLEAAHLQKLVIPLGAGFVIALVPTLIRLPIHLNFVIFCVFVLLALIALRISALSLRK